MCIDLNLKLVYHPFRLVFNVKQSSIQIICLLWLSARENDEFNTNFTTPCHHQDSLLQFCAEVRKINNMDSRDTRRFLSFAWGIVTPGSYKTEHKTRHGSTQNLQSNKVN
jgi:hypothetical protein